MLEVRWCQRQCREYAFVFLSSRQVLRRVARLVAEQSGKRLGGRVSFRQWPKPPKLPEGRDDGRVLVRGADHLAFR